MFLLRLRAGRFVLCGPGFDCLFHLAGGGQQRYYHRCRQNREPLLCCFSFPIFSFFTSLGRGKELGGGGVTWYLLVAIPRPPDISLPSPGMMGVLDVAGRQERFSAKTYTTQECPYWKKEDFSKASPIIWLDWSYMGSIICGVRVVFSGGTTPRIASQSSIVTESPDFIHSIHQGVQRKSNALYSNDNICITNA